MIKSFNYIISPEINEFKRLSPNLKIGVLASGEGTNFQELINLTAVNNFDVDIKVLISNNEEAGCINRSKNANIPHKIIKQKNFSSNKLFEMEIINTLISYDVELVVMAGWMKIISADFVNKFKNKIINIHPSILPSFKGNNAIKEALSSGSKITGCSVHFVEKEVDSGLLIMQAALSVLKNDNLESLSRKIQILEHKILPLSITEAGYLIREKLMDSD